MSRHFNYSDKIDLGNSCYVIMYVNYAKVNEVKAIIYHRNYAG